VHGASRVFSSSSCLHPNDAHMLWLAFKPLGNPDSDPVSAICNLDRLEL
jgi:hypothetical protein